MSRSRDRRPNAFANERSSSTFYLSDGTNRPPLVEAELKRDPKAFALGDEVLRELEGRTGAGRKWAWDVFERAYVEGVIGEDGERRWPSLVELSKWSGCHHVAIKQRSSKHAWSAKKKIHEERLPALVEESVTRHVAENIGPYLAAADEAIKRRSAREWVREIAEPYLHRTLKRLSGDLENDGVRPPSPTVQDAEKLMKLLLLIEGEATSRVEIAGCVQANLNLQRNATVEALKEAEAKGFVEDGKLGAVLEIVQSHVSRVRWRYRVDPSEIAKAAG